MGTSDPEEDRAETRAEIIEIDARGKPCPQPVIDLARAMGEADRGAVVRLLADDPAAKVDVPVWCRMQRQALRSSVEEEGIWTFHVEKVRAMR